MDIQAQKNTLIPDYIVETVFAILEESMCSDEPVKQIALRVAAVSYASGLHAGLNAALLLSEETNSKIHTAIN
jgi:hypothetical protein